MLKTNGIEVHDSISGRSFTIHVDGPLRETAGDYKLAARDGLKLVVLDADGLELRTQEFKLVRGEKVRIIVTAESNGAASTTPQQTLAADSDRRAAEYVLSIGGTIGIEENRQERQVGAVGDLPRGTFELTLGIPTSRVV